MTETTPTNTTTTAPNDNVGNEIIGQQTGMESSLSNWAGDYVTGMLGKGQALADKPYEAYTGPLTAGASNLQQQAFQGVAGLAVPQNMGEFQPGSFTDTGVADRYMSPFIEGALNPQLQELLRQKEIERINQSGRLTQAGAYGGGRQAVMDSELTRNYLDQVAQTTGAGYQNAYNQAADQFNTEQRLGYDASNQNNQFGLAALQRQADMGDVQRQIEAQGVAADRAQFEEEQAFPYKQVQYQQSLLQGLPLEAQNFNFAQPSQLQQVLSSASGVSDLYGDLFGKSGSGGIGDLLGNAAGGIADLFGWGAEGSYPSQLQIA